MEYHFMLLCGVWVKLETDYFYFNHSHIEQFRLTNKDPECIIFAYRDHTALFTTNLCYILSTVPLTNLIVICLEV